jgi:hypothetical protein
LGSDYTKVEERLASALSVLRANAGSSRALAGLALRGWRRGPVAASANPCLERLGLARPASLREKYYRALLLAVLE